MGAEGTASKAPTAVIETLIVVRPIKVIGVLCAVLGTLLLLLSIAATAWLKADGTREGLWERCIYNETNSDYLHCHLGHFEGWVVACQILSVISLLTCVTGIIITSLGLNTANFKTKYSFYWAGLVLFFVAVFFELLSLIVFPIKFLEEVENREKADWNFGWAYIVGWMAAISQFAAGMFLLLDRGAEEIIYRERVVQEEDKNGIETTEDV